VQGHPRIIDLFCGCGGFSLGAHAAGISPTIAFDNDPILTSSFPFNFPATKLVRATLRTVDGDDIKRELGGSPDGIIGGPPCQAFSDIGHRKASDPRRNLVGHFFRLVAQLRPSFFVMENVRGLGYSTGRPTLDRSLELVPNAYKIVGPVTLDAAEFGAATRRPRLFVIGYNPSRCDPITEGDLDNGKVGPATVRAAIGDLCSPTYVDEVDGYDFWKISRKGRPSAYALALRNPNGHFSGYRATAHSKLVVSRFSKLRPGEVDPIGRHPKLSWDGQCPNLRAGTGNDRGSYQSVRPIHPEEPRVITVREGARLLGYPDSFRFHPTIWHSFRMIGNSVSPTISKALLSLIASRTELRSKHPKAKE